MQHNYYISIDEAVKLFNKEKNKFAEVMKDDSMTVEYFAYKNIDEQQLHTKDELYIIASGNLQFHRKKKELKKTFIISN